jgi:hypothetical protein
MQATQADDTEEVDNVEESLQIRQFPDNTLPPEGIYESREALFTTVNTWAKHRGYAFTSGKSYKTPNGRTKVVVACDRNKPPQNPLALRKRKTSSRATGYKFSVLAKESRDKNSWVLAYRPGKEYAQHNHPPSEDPSTHPVHRLLQKEEKSTISNLVIAGVAPRNIRIYLSRTSETLATA